MGGKELCETVDWEPEPGEEELNGRKKELGETVDHEPEPGEEELNGRIKNWVRPWIGSQSQEKKS